MERKRIIIENSQQQLQEFGIDEYEDHCVIGSLLSKEVEQVEIPAEINEKPVTAIGGDCFFACKNIKCVLLPESISELGVQAFAMCKGLTEIILPDGISNIGAFAFRDCTGLRKVVMSSGLKILRTGTFGFCYLPDKAEIILKEGLEEIESRVFSSGGLNLYFTLKLPKSVKKIAPGAFEPGMNIITDLPYDSEWFNS